MQYREKLLDLIVNGSQEEMHAWLKAQPPLEQVDIMREMQSIMADIAEETDDDVTENLADADNKINNYEDAILNEQLALLKQDMAERELEKKIDEADAAIQDIRNKIVAGILANGPNTDTLKRLANELIEGEKKAGIYNPANWNAIE